MNDDEQSRNLWARNGIFSTFFAANLTADLCPAAAQYTP